MRYKSLFKERVKVFKLYPEDTANYECIGYVARQIKKDGTLEQKFEFNKYACLHKRYLTPAEHDRLQWKSYDDDGGQCLKSPGPAKNNFETDSFLFGRSLNANRPGPRKSLPKSCIILYSVCTENEKVGKLGIVAKI